MFTWQYGRQLVKPDPTNPNGFLVLNRNGLNSTDGLYRYNGTSFSGKLAGSFGPTSLPGEFASTVYDAAIDPSNGQRIVMVQNQDQFKEANAARGVWQTLDGGATWERQNTGLSMLRGRTINFSPDGDRIIVGLNGGGFFVVNGDGSAFHSGGNPPPPPGGDGTPFGGTAPSIAPTGTTTIPVEDFNDGGQGVAYNDSEPGNQGGAYRSTGVDLESVSVIPRGPARAAFGLRRPDGRR